MRIRATFHYNILLTSAAAITRAMREEASSRLEMPEMTFVLLTLMGERRFMGDSLITPRMPCTHKCLLSGHRHAPKLTVKYSMMGVQCLSADFPRHIISRAAPNFSKRDKISLPIDTRVVMS